MTWNKLPQIVGTKETVLKVRIDSEQIMGPFASNCFEFFIIRNFQMHTSHENILFYAPEIQQNQICPAK